LRSVKDSNWNPENISIETVVGTFDAVFEEFGNLLRKKEEIFFGIVNWKWN
jgi:hypothetical protein